MQDKHKINKIKESWADWLVRSVRLLRGCKASERHLPYKVVGTLQRIRVRRCFKGLDRDPLCPKRYEGPWLVHVYLSRGRDVR
jgi:hypothetical protein